MDERTRPDLDAADLSELRSEGDLNLSPRRAAWRATELGAQTRRWLEEDERYFLRQSLSTPCLDVLRRSEGSWLEDLGGRRILDFHGNSVHQVGFGHPRVLAAIRHQIDELPFCPRRYTNLPAIRLPRRDRGPRRGGALQRVREGAQLQVDSRSDHRVDPAADDPPRRARPGARDPRGVSGAGEFRHPVLS